jgi:predicted DCC family thiol-disulfide oxidoreductase YuxK
VNTAKSERKGISGRVFYDAECPICRKGRRVWGEIFDRRGFVWLPLQTPGVVGLLGLSEAALLEEMKVQLPDGRVIGGIDSWVVLFRSVWWLWPIGTLLAVPGFHRLGQVCYCWIARNRYCFGGKCVARTEQPRRRTMPFMDLP